MRQFRLAAIATFILLLVSSTFATGEGGGFQPLPSLWAMLFGHDGPLHHIIDIVYALATSILFAIVAIKVYRNRQMIPGKLQNFLELCVEGMFNFISTILGSDAKKYTPFLGTLFFYILINNLWGIIPGGHSPSTNINVTASLAIMVFLYSQYTGITRLGIVGFVDHLAGQPRNLIGWLLLPLLLPIHIIGELAKPFSLAVRLFSNITSEDVLVAAFVGLGLMALSFLHSPVGLPLNVPFILLGLMVSTIQALVFTLLSTIYILLMLPHEESH
jgi:F-type H+-transporting ATPase subunit a